ncbi:CHAD domain-containing protein [Halopseudomonas pachastrellae]|nr:CHAD domain-containing protein [Halopseudomonas pachastrellae]
MLQTAARPAAALSPYTGHQRLRQLDQQIRLIAKSLAGRRDLHVQQQLISQLARDLERPLSPALNSQLLQSSGNHSLVAADNERIIAAFAAILSDWPHCDSGRRDAWAAGLARTRKRARSLARRACNSDQDALFHRCRKWTKYYLYQLEQLHDSRLPASSEMQTLARLGEQLGQLQDCATWRRSCNTGTGPGERGACRAAGKTQRSLQAAYHTLVHQGLRQTPPGRLTAQQGN